MRTRPYTRGGPDDAPASLRGVFLRTAPRAALPDRRDLSSVYSARLMGADSGASCVPFAPDTDRQAWWAGGALGRPAYSGHSTAWSFARPLTVVALSPGIWRDLLSHQP